VRAMQKLRHCFENCDQNSDECAGSRLVTLNEARALAAPDEVPGQES